MGTLGHRYYYSFAAKKETPKTRMTVTLVAVNLFAKYTTQQDIKQRTGFVSVVDNRYYNHAQKLTVNWELGGKLQQRQRKKIDNDDINVQGKG